MKIVVVVSFMRFLLWSRDPIAYGFRSHKSYDSWLGHFDGGAFARLPLQGL
jgi:hypothetical protein